MLSDLYLDKKPFAICLNYEGFGDIGCDTFIITPINYRLKRDISEFQEYNIRTHEPTKRDLNWIKNNKDNLRLAHKCDHGVVYEPKYCNFKKQVK